MILRILWTITALVVLLLLSSPARALDYGGSIGPAIPLLPHESAGGILTLSSVATGEDGLPAHLLRARGEVFGILTPDAQAALPTLNADLGVSLSTVDLFVTGGVELFGFAWRDEAALFSTLGLLGGAGVSWQVTPTVRLVARGIALWLPDRTTAIVQMPEEADKPSILFVMGLLGVELEGGPRSGGWAL